MSNTYKHKVEGKFRNNIAQKIPISVINMWARHNWNVGERRKNRIKKLIKILDRCDFK